MYSFEHLHDMIRDFFNRRDRNKNPVKGAASQSIQKSPQTNKESVDKNYYPLKKRRYRVLPVEDILNRQEKTVKQIMTTTVFSTANEYYTKQRYEQIIQEVASYCHLIPASQYHHHRLPGGLIQHSLEVGLYSIQKAASQLLPKLNIHEIKHILEPAWYYTVFLSGLLHDIGKVATDVMITTPDGGQRWNPLKHSLTEWAQRNNITEYCITWIPNRTGKHEEINAIMAALILTKANLGEIIDADKDLFYWLINALSYKQTHNNNIYEYMKEADRYSVERDIASQEALEEQVPGIDRIIMDNIRQMICDNTLRINQPGAEIWIQNGETYLIWPEILKKVANQLAKNKYPGVPRSIPDLNNIVREYNIVMPQPYEVKIKIETQTHEMMAMKLNPQYYVYEGEVGKAEMTVHEVGSEVQPSAESNTNETPAPKPEEMRKQEQGQGQGQKQEQEGDIQQEKQNQPNFLYHDDFLKDFLSTILEGTKSGQTKYYCQRLPEGIGLQYPEYLELNNTNANEIFKALKSQGFLEQKDGLYIFDQNDETGKPIQYIIVKNDALKKYEIDEDITEEESEDEGAEVKNAIPIDDEKIQQVIKKIVETEGPHTVIKNDKAVCIYHQREIEEWIQDCLDDYSAAQLSKTTIKQTLNTVLGKLGAKNQKGVITIPFERIHQTVQEIKKGA